MARIDDNTFETLKRLNISVSGVIRTAIKEAISKASRKKLMVLLLSVLMFACAPEKRVDKGYQEPHKPLKSLWYGTYEGELRIFDFREISFTGQTQYTMFTASGAACIVTAEFSGDEIEGHWHAISAVWENTETECMVDNGLHFYDMKGLKLQVCEVVCADLR